ncbi:hypothetical protein WDW89_23420 [Deltaproteobacteria bacterium TL4]
MKLKDNQYNQYVAKIIFLLQDYLASYAISEDGSQHGIVLPLIQEYRDDVKLVGVNIVYFYVDVMKADLLYKTQFGLSMFTYV